jgi:adenylate cyclase
VAIDFDKEGLLDGTQGNARDARKQLLEELANDGVPLDELRTAVQQDRLALLPVERVLGGEPKYTREEVAELVGLEVGLLERQREALGFPRLPPGERILTEDDVEAAKVAKSFLEAGLPEEGILENARLIGLAMRRVAEANQALIGDAMLAGAQGNERDVAHGFAAAAQAFLPLAGSLLQYALKSHLRESVRGAAVDQAAIAAGELPGASEVAVCFADMVGFTEIGERLSAAEIAAMGGRLGEMATDIAKGPVRLVKLIGDAVMLVSPEILPMAESVLQLIEAVEAEEDFPRLSAGMSFGPAMNRAGDWYGAPVNLASRITGVARPHSLLVTREARDALRDADAPYEYSRTKSFRLKGIEGAVSLYRVRPAETDADGGGQH